MNSNTINQRIEKAYKRMLNAKTQCWQKAWGDSFVVHVRARNAMRDRDELREIERARGLR